MGESGDSKSKKIKTEAGTRISASYKTNVYQKRCNCLLENADV